MMIEQKRQGYKTGGVFVYQESHQMTGVAGWHPEDQALRVSRAAARAFDGQTAQDLPPFHERCRVVVTVEVFPHDREAGMHEPGDEDMAGRIDYSPDIVTRSAADMFADMLRTELDVRILSRSVTESLLGIGANTPERVAALSDEQLLMIDGVGPALLKRIRDRWGTPNGGTESNAQPDGRTEGATAEFGGDDEGGDLEGVINEEEGDLRLPPSGLVQ